MPRITNITFRKGTSIEWSTINPILDSGEPGYDSTNQKLKIGDGTTPWNSLRYEGVVSPVIEGSLVVPAGTTASPSIVFVNNTNTGIFSPSANSLAISTGGSERLRISSTGAVRLNNAYTLPTTDGLSGQALVTNGAGTVSWTNISSANTAIKNVCDGRLSASITQSVTSESLIFYSTQLYYVPHTGNQVSLYNGTNWVVREFSAITIYNTGLTANRVHDIFLYWNDAVVGFESVQVEVVPWSNNTTRAVGLTSLHGIPVKSTDTKRRYIGSVFVDSSLRFSENSGTRYIWNYYNRVPRSLSASDSTVHSYTTSTYRYWNNGSSLPILRYLIGYAQDVVAINVGLLELISYFTNGFLAIAFDGNFNQKICEHKSANANTVTYINSPFSSSIGTHDVSVIESGQTGNSFSSVTMRGYIDA